MECGIGSGGSIVLFLLFVFVVETTCKQLKMKFDLSDVEVE